FFQAEDGIRDRNVTGVQTCALPISDVFVSIHVNAAPRRDARGAETYYLAYQSVDQEAADLAAAENASAGGAAAGLGAGSAGLVLWDLAQAEHLRESSELAQIVQKEIGRAHV